MNIQALDERKQQEIREFLEDYKEVKKHLFIRLYNRERLGQLAEKLVHRDFLEFAITCHIDISPLLGIDASVPVMHALAASLGVEGEQLIEDAIGSSPFVKPAKVAPVETTMNRLLGLPGRDDAPDGEWQLHVVTNFSIAYGASAILYPGVLGKLAGELGGNLFLIPSSVHEFLALRDDCGIGKEALEWMIREVNREEVAEKDRLSDFLYRFDRETGEVRPA